MQRKKQSSYVGSVSIQLGGHYLFDLIVSQMLLGCGLRNCRLFSHTTIIAESFVSLCWRKTQSIAVEFWTQKMERREAQKDRKVSDSRSCRHVNVLRRKLHSRHGLATGRKIL